MAYENNNVRTGANCLSYDDTRTNINLIKKTGYSNEEIIATYDYPHQTNFSRYKPGIVLAKG